MRDNDTYKVFDNADRMIVDMAKNITEDGDHEASMYRFESSMRSGSPLVTIFGIDLKGSLSGLSYGYHVNEGHGGLNMATLGYFPNSPVISSIGDNDDRMMSVYVHECNYRAVPYILVYSWIRSLVANAFSNMMYYRRVSVSFHDIHADEEDLDMIGRHASSSLYGRSIPQITLRDGVFDNGTFDYTDVDIMNYDYPKDIMEYRNNINDLLLW